MTRHVSDAEFRKNPAKYIDEVTDTGTPLHIERDAGSVVIMPEEEFEGWKETIYLLQNPANAKELLDAVKAADAGEFEEHKPLSKK